MRTNKTKIPNFNLGFGLIFFVFFLGINCSFAQFDVPEIPSFQTSVYDYAAVLSASEKEALESKLIRYSDSTSTQILVVTIESLKGESIGILTPKWAQKWGIGQAKEDNGVLILLAKAERKIHISAGYGVEDRLTAGITGELIRNIIIPEFKAGSYYNGLDQGADAIFEVLKGKYKGTRKESGGKFPIILVVIFIIILILLISRGSRGGGNSGNSGNSGGFDLADIIILSSLGRSGGGGFGGGSFGGGSSGGGFGGGFGGGGFSGGGAGGSW
jgi:uncharacterized protein